MRFSILLAVACCSVAAASPPPLGHPGFHATYEASSGNVASFEVRLGAESGEGFQWIRLTLHKRADRSSFQIWTLRNREGDVRRYLVDEGGSRGIREYAHELTGEAVLPSHGGWRFQWPDPLPVSEDSARSAVQLLGHAFQPVRAGIDPVVDPPASPRVVRLRPDLWIGPASNTRQKDETRRYDGSDYELIPLSQADYRVMLESGVTVVKAAPGEQQRWAEDLGLYFWGPHERLRYPEFLYRSQYLGPALFLDEPAVGTRDHDLRPRLAKDSEFRHTITPDIAFRAYQEHYAKTIRQGPAQMFLRTLAQRKDVDLGAMSFPQSNLFNWETMPATAAWAMSQDARVPAAMVFEPPGRMGSRRTLPEFNMAYGTHFATDDMRVLPAVIGGFLRGAARQTGKEWGVSIYGAVERADSFWWLTRAYDLGASRFFFWDNYQLACVPFGEMLALSRHLRAHTRQHPRRDVTELRKNATRAITLPPGYNLGHTHMGRGNLWGLPELNLERLNSRGVSYRDVMSRFFGEIERSLREGVEFDLLWDLPGLHLDYPEVIRIEERAIAARPDVPGRPPQLEVRVASEGAGSRFKAIARIMETDAPVYYTHGADASGILRNAMVLWELYGPQPEDYRFLMAPAMQPVIRQVGPRGYEVECVFEALQPGVYRLRAATADTHGRSTVVWTPVKGK